MKKNFRASIFKTYYSSLFVGSTLLFLVTCLLNPSCFVTVVQARINDDDVNNNSQEESTEKIDQIATRLVEELGIPGMAVAVVAAEDSGEDTMTEQHFLRKGGSR